MNLTIFQCFHWYNTPEERLWVFLQEKAGYFAELGITHVWLPPAYKSAMGAGEPGYAVYDLYDLGEFDQKGSVPTRYGTLQEYKAAIDRLHEAGIKVLADIVLNHKLGGDKEEQIPVVTVDAENRKKWISEEHWVSAPTLFTFPGRAGKYSDFIWDHRCFTGLKLNDEIKLIRHEYTDKGWDDVPAQDRGSFDYLMGCDIEFRNPYVREELKKWAVWYREKVGFDGWRLDGLKHISYDFFPEWLNATGEIFPQKPLVIGEYWNGDMEPLNNYLEKTGYCMQLFDVPLHFRFFEGASRLHEFDLRTIRDGTLMHTKPEYAITFVDNHDTQPKQSLESFVGANFKTHAYAFILLREQGIPCVFYADFFGASYHDGGDENNQEKIVIEKVSFLEQLMRIRKEKAYGLQSDHFDSPNLIGWTRQGTDDSHTGCAVLLNTGDTAELSMEMGQKNGGRKMVVAGNNDLSVTLDEQGKGNFTAQGNIVTIYVFQD